MNWRSIKFKLKIRLSIIIAVKHILIIALPVKAKRELQAKLEEVNSHLEQQVENRSCLHLICNISYVVHSSGSAR